MDLHEKEAEQLVKRIFTVIESIKVVNSTDSEPGAPLFAVPSINYSDPYFGEYTKHIEEMIKPLNDKNKNEFLSLFGHLGVMNIIFGPIIAALNSKPGLEPYEKTVSIDEYFSNDEMTNFAQRAFSTIVGYPHEYIVFVKVPKMVTAELSPDINAPVTLIKASGQTIQGFELPSKPEGFAAHLAEALGHGYYYDYRITEYKYNFWEKGMTYIQLRMPGFLDSVGNVPYIPMVLDRLLSVVGLALCIGLIKIENEFQRMFEYDAYYDASSLSFPVFDMSHEIPRKPIRWLRLAQAHSVILESIEPDNWTQDILDTFDALLRTIKQGNQFSKYVYRILNASRWYFDSISEEVASHSYLQASIGLEVMLGDEKGKGKITERLADRFSYVVAKSMYKRKKLRNLFNEIYEYRSRIVHSGFSLDYTKHSSELYMVRQALKMVISSETVKLWGELKKHLHR